MEVDLTLMHRTVSWPHTPVQYCLALLEWYAAFSNPSTAATVAAELNWNFLEEQQQGIDCLKQLSVITEHTAWVKVSCYCSFCRLYAGHKKEHWDNSAVDRKRVSNIYTACRAYLVAQPT